MPEDKKLSPAVVIIPIGLGLAAVVGLATLAWAKPPTPPPGKANLYGKVTDSVTGMSISGVFVSLNGYSTYTSYGGKYIFEDLEPGGYVLQFSKDGYHTLVYQEGEMATITLYEGNNEINVQLTPIAVPVANLYGKVTDAETGYPLSGVKVTIDGLVAYTDAGGFYGFAGLAIGSYSIEFYKEGYETVVR